MTPFSRKVIRTIILLITLTIKKQDSVYSFTCCIPRLFVKTVEQNVCDANDSRAISRLYSFSSDSHNAIYTELETLNMRSLVLSISAERDDEKRRSHVLKWLTARLNDEDQLEGNRLIHLWDATVIELGEQFQ